MKTFEQMKDKWMQDPEFRAEYERIEREEMPALDAILKARKEAKITQKEIAQRMGVSAPAVSRLENSLVTGKNSPTIATLQKYAAAMGKKLEIRFV